MNKKTILTIDDDPVIAILAEEVFAAHGYQVISASCGEDALAQIVDVDPDIILLDIMMPGISGYETCRRIKAIPEFEHTPIIMLTGREDIESVEKAYESGAWDFSSKPINWPMLTYRVRHALLASQAFANEKQAARLSRAIDNSPSEVLIFEGDCLKILSGNTSAQSNLGYTSAELKDLKLEDISELPAEKQLEARILRLEEGAQIKLNGVMKRKDGSNYPAEGVLIRSPEKGHPTWIVILQDISERKRSEQALHRLAYYDELTGLPNRRLLYEHVERALAIAYRSQTVCAICILDLDGFKRINDTLGHKVGDMLLQEVSHRVSAMLRQYDVVAHEADNKEDDTQTQNQVARLGGDEFLILLTELEDPAVPARVAGRLLREISRPYNVHKTELNLTGSIGISLYPQDGASLDELMMHADTAMYKAKQSGKNNYAFFTKADGDHSAERLTLESELRSAINNRELELHYQPQLDNSLTHIVGAEALLRWRHPVRGLLSPDNFIPLAEETGMIISIGEWVLQEALEQLQQWTALVPADFKMAVNISGYQLRSDGFLPTMYDLLDKHSCVRYSIVFELTESTLMGSAQSSIEWLRKIKEAGVQIAVDDFGTGYSSLSYLQKFPIDYLKVDRSFVSNLDTNREGAAIVKAIFRMAQALDINLTVEGVETYAELETLRTMGDSLIQGWLISKALLPAEFVAFLEHYRGTAEVQGLQPDDAGFAIR